MTSTANTAELFVLLDQLSSGDAEDVVRQDSAVNIELTTVSPPLTELLPRFQADVVVGNLEKARVVAETSGAEAVRCHRSATVGLMLRRTRCSQCVGIGLHSEDHCYLVIHLARSIRLVGKRPRVTKLRRYDDES